MTRIVEYTTVEFAAVESALRKARADVYKDWTAARLRGAASEDSKALLDTYDGLLTKHQTMRGSR